MATDYTKDISFINKRIDEQMTYNNELCLKHVKKELNDERFDEIYNSSISQFYHFINLRDQFYESKDKLPTIQK